MREYQQKRLKDFLLPETVYRQALWATKDMVRMREQLAFEIECAGNLPSSDFVKSIGHSSSVCDLTGDKAIRIANLTLRIEKIEEAFTSIPEKYRKGLSEKLFYGKPFDDAYHQNTWKKWQQVFIYNVAINLGLY